MRQPRWRKARREALRAQDIQPVNTQLAVVVRVGHMSILPAWLNSRLIPGLVSVRGLYWLKHKDAMALMTFLRTVAVRYSATEAEFKRCVRCSRPLLGQEATGLRKAMETVTDRKTLICGPNCDKENESGLWRRLGVDLAA